MLKIYTIPVGMLQTNCYLVCREGTSSCLVIDPGDSARKIQKKLDAEGLSIDSILLTHGHFDHVGAVKELAQAKLPELTIRIENVGPVIGAHAGPGTLALCFMGKKRPM